MSVDESMVIFGPIDQVGWARASSMVTSASSALRAAAERPAGRGEHDAAHPLAARAVRVLRAQALVDGAVLAVDGHQLAGARLLAHASHDRAGRDERLLVGEREPLAGLERRQRDAQPGEADDAVHAHVAQRGDVGERVRAGDDLGARGHERLELRRLRVVGDGDDRRTPPLRLRGQLLDRRPRARAPRRRTAPARPRSPRAPAPRSTPSTRRSTTDVVTAARLLTTLGSTPRADRLVRTAAVPGAELPRSPPAGSGGSTADGPDPRSARRRRTERLRGGSPQGERRAT